ncbi:multidrug effflux MFS transporter [Flavobacterium hercynium]|uniref:Major facilitator superfamily (MFS) profile domain-containing protein n=1 Tax=Flavobacterium hercynium TaxID=387094 RepID=A0A226H836_9FLAO|nr:multidrug effflux MFS transporter [Flavobacterium hercynium]OXA90008.1 hypothetical protein B0A66_13470 [Flavobacterium hercynium]SMP14348.1 MFS transporter, DHA1 family, bicyclomycin/chloramphenicol resistance protein [Flavobacterium hercynium]
MKTNQYIVPILAIITALESLSIDLYLPAFTHITQDLQTTMGNVQISVSLFLCGFATGQLLWGPLSDKYGRKPILLIGLVVFVLSSAAIPFADYIELLWILRFMQAFGGCAGIVMSRAVVADLFSKEAAIKIFSTQSQISGIAPIIAPIMGSVLLNLWGWRSIFFFLALLGTLSIGTVLKWIPETHARSRNDKRTSKSSLKENVVALSKNKSFLLFTLIGAMAYSALMIYISSAPFVLITKAGLSETEFGLAFGFNSVALIFAAYITPKLYKFMPIKTLVKTATIALVLFCTASLLFSLANASVIITIATLFLSLIPLGILFPITTALALETIEDGKGTAAAVMGFSQLMISFLLSAITGLVQNNEVWPIEVIRLGVSLFAVVLAMSGIRSRKFTPLASKTM